MMEGGKPRNPRGRTGMTGRGTLGKWGPNQAADPIVTRWNPDDPDELQAPLALTLALALALTLTLTLTRWWRSSVGTRVTGRCRGAWWTTARR